MCVCVTMIKQPDARSALHAYLSTLLFKDKYLSEYLHHIHISILPSSRCDGKPRPNREEEHGNGLCRTDVFQAARSRVSSRKRELGTTYLGTVQSYSYT